MDSADPPDHRARVVAVATRLLADGGRDAVSTRAVSAAAGIAAPTLYRLFGDKQGLLDAVASQGFATSLAASTDLDPTGDPVDDLRAGWNLHVELGLAQPALYTLMYAEPRPGRTSPAAAAAFRVLAAHVHRIAAAGRLRLAEPVAAAVVHAAGSGTTLALIATPPDRRDPALSPTVREAVVAAVTTDAPPVAAPGPVGAAVALRAVLPHTDALSPAECRLLAEWLDRIAAAPPARAGRAG